MQRSPFDPIDDERHRLFSNEEICYIWHIKEGKTSYDKLLNEWHYIYSIQPQYLRLPGNRGDPDDFDNYGRNQHDFMHPPVKPYVPGSLPKLSGASYLHWDDQHWDDTLWEQIELQMAGNQEWRQSMRTRRTPPDTILNALSGLDEDNTCSLWGCIKQGLRCICPNSILGKKSKKQRPSKRKSKKRMSRRR